MSDVSAVGSGATRDAAVQPWLVGATNARDLGGLPTRDGRRVRPGVLFRAPALGRLTDADVEALAAVGLVEVIDLRFGSEIMQAPPDRLPAGPHLAHVPVHDPDHPVFEFATALLSGVDTPQSRELRAAGAYPAMCAVYAAFVTSEAARAGFARAAQRVLACRGRPVLWHCSFGKDRTGWLSAILLGALGVEPAAIEADYLRTNTDLAGVVGKLVDSAWRKRGIEPGLVRPVLAAAPGYLAAAYAEVERGYGDFDRYLAEGLGLDALELVEFRDAVLE